MHCRNPPCNKNSFSVGSFFYFACIQVFQDYLRSNNEQIILSLLPHRARQWRDVRWSAVVPLYVGLIYLYRLKVINYCNFTQLFTTSIWRRILFARIVLHLLPPESWQRSARFQLAKRVQVCIAWVARPDATYIFSCDYLIIWYWELLIRSIWANLCAYVQSFVLNNQQQISK